MGILWSGAKAVQKLAVFGHSLGQILCKVGFHKSLPPKLSCCFLSISLACLRPLFVWIRSDQRESDCYRTPPSHWRGAASWKSSSWQYLLKTLRGETANEIFSFKTCRLALPLALAWRYYSTYFWRKKVEKLTSDGWILTSVNGLLIKYVPNNVYFMKFL